MNIKQKIKLHDRLYRYADKLIKKHNPCKIKNGKCIDGDFCCDGCEHLTESGCSVNCLRCKLCLCWAARGNIVLDRAFDRILQKAHRHNIVHFRQSREQVIKILYKWEKIDLEIANVANSNQ